jgi:hypothetical protein
VQRTIEAISIMRSERGACKNIAEEASISDASAGKTILEEDAEVQTSLIACTYIYIRRRVSI